MRIRDIKGVDQNHDCYPPYQMNRLQNLLLLQKAARGMPAIDLSQTPKILHRRKAFRGPPNTHFAFDRGKDDKLG